MLGSKPKPEKVIKFSGYKAVDEANKWLDERCGTVDIIQRDTHCAPNQSAEDAIFIWYRERGE